MQKGFSVVKVIIILVIIAALGVGGYFAYNNYFVNFLNPNAGFIPEDLKEYAKGENADIFIILNDKDEQINNLAQNFDLPEEFMFDLKSGIIISDSSEQCGLSVFKFNSLESADNAKKLIENNLATELGPMVETKIEQKDTVIILDGNDGMNCLSGSLMDNHVFKNLDPEYIDNQLILALDNQELIELLMIFGGGLNTIMMGANIPTAHAQLINPGDTPDSISYTPESSAGNSLRTILRPVTGFILAAESTILYSEVKDSNMNMTLKVKLLEESEIEKSTIFSTMSEIESEELFNELDKFFNEDIIEQISIIEEEYENIQITSEYKDLLVTLTAEFDVEKVINDAIESAADAESRGRDIARMGNLNNYLASIYAYEADYGTFPDESGCFDEVFGDLANDYFSGGLIPKDPNGEQTFGDLTCENGYYYQYLNENSIALWAKMEVEENGNTDLLPEDLEELVNKGEMPETSEAGIYYLIQRIELPLVEEEPTKVPRKQ